MELITQEENEELKNSLAVGCVPDEYDPAVPNVFDEIISSPADKRKSQQQLANHQSPPPVNHQLPATGPSPFALSLLMKMGWSAGSGLGREQQGIKAPLIHEQVNSRTGFIKQAEALTFQAPMAEPTAPSRAICLKNVVTLGDVDDELEGEIAEEASKFGNLVNVNISQNAEALADSDKVVVVCEYESVADATEALKHFHGRFFGGRIVAASFHPMPPA